MTADVIIVGGGVSGALIAIQLLRQSPFPVDIHLIEKQAVPGRGVAYNPQSSAWLLNVPAGKMSALPDQPTHFLDWLQRHRIMDSYGKQPTEQSFLPRAIYGQYIAAMLHETQNKAAQLTLHKDEALDITQAGTQVHVHLRSGQPIAARHAVLALGNFAPRPLPFISEDVRRSPQIINNPWQPDAFALIPPQADVLIIGTGLTMADTVIALYEQLHVGQITAISRHGLAPLGHQVDPQTGFVFLDGTTDYERILPLLQTVRREVRYARQRGYSWHAVTDALRPLTQKLWQELPLEEKHRFLRHLRPYWEVLRHRVAPQVAVLLNSLQASGQLYIGSGRFKEIALDENRLKATFIDGQPSQHFDYVINCTGANQDYRTVESPLVENLLKRGTIHPHPTEVGLAVRPSGAVINAQGVESAHLFTIGCPRKGELWESTAVPEIRVQAADLAALLIGSLFQQPQRDLSRTPLTSRV